MVRFSSFSASDRNWRTIAAYVLPQTEGFDQLVVADHTRTKPVVEEFPLGLDQHYANLTDAKQLLVPEVLRRLAAANLPPALGGWVPGDFGRALGVAVEGASARGTELLKDAGQTATELFKGLREKLEESRKP